MSILSKYCSLACKNITHNLTTRSHILDGREQEFIKYYNLHKSINKALISMNKRGVNHYYVWANKVIVEYGL